MDSQLESWMRDLRQRGSLGSAWELRAHLDELPNSAAQRAEVVQRLVSDIAGAVRPDLALLFGADLIGNDHVSAWLSPLHETASLELLSHLSLEPKQLLQLLRHEDSRVRSVAPILWAVLPELSGEFADALVASASEDPFEEVRASALLALGRLAPLTSKGEELLLERALSERISPAENGAATVALLRHDDTVKISECRGGIANWITLEGGPCGSGEPRVGWFNTTFGRAMFSPIEPECRILSTLAARRDARAELTELSLSLDTHGCSTKALQRAGQLFLDGSGLAVDYPPRETWVLVRPYESLTPVQQEGVRALTNTRLVPNAALGVPASGRCRRSWAHLDAPTLLDTQALGGPRGSAEKPRPLWSFFTGNQRSLVDSLTVLGRTLGGLDRWEALVELAAGTYGGSPVVRTQDAIETEVRAAIGQPGILDRVKRLADELVERFSVSALVEPEFSAPYLSLLLLLPVCRLDQALPQRWDCLVFLSDLPQTAELLGRIPEPRRTAIVQRSLENMRLGDPLGPLMKAVPLCSSKGLRDGALAHLDRVAKVFRIGDAELAEYRRNIGQGIYGS